MFLCAGEVQNADAKYQVMSRITKDGAYHTISIDLTQLSYWTGDVNSIRVDFFDQSEVGDTMYIKSIKLIEK